MFSSLFAPNLLPVFYFALNLVPRHQNTRQNTCNFLLFLLNLMDIAIEEEEEEEVNKCFDECFDDEVLDLRRNRKREVS